MKTVVVYESSFGNTRAMAEAVACGVEDGGGEVRLIEAANAPVALPPDIDLVIIGAPTHNMGMPTSTSRAKAAEADGSVQASAGIREWLAGVQPSADIPVAAFDTAVSSRFSGSAAKSIAKIARRRGFAKPLAIKSFVVIGTKGPLQSGQIEAASVWGRRLVG